MSVVLDFGVADSTDKLDVECACNLELKSGFNSVILFLHVCQRYV